METTHLISTQNLANHTLLLSMNASLLEEANRVAQEIYLVIEKYRRTSSQHKPCVQHPCPECFSPHLTKIIQSVFERKPISFVLPAFPGKSPNPSKVISSLPDKAEYCALESIQMFCREIQKVYSPGAKMILCSDGRVFSDAVGISDQDVSAYQKEISKMLEENKWDSISTFNLEDCYGPDEFNQMRDALLLKYGEPLESLKEKISRGKFEDSNPENRALHQLYCGITRFLLEDSIHPLQKKSKTALQKECRLRAYEVIQKSNAWSNLIEDQFSDAIRFSIHPQGCGFKKFGFQLMGVDGWMTPWHGVALKSGEKFSLVKKSEAETLGAQIVFEKGRPHYYELKVTIGGVHNEG